MVVENNVPLQAFNTFGIQARADVLLRVRSTQDVVDAVAQHPSWLRGQPLILGGGSNLVLTGDLSRAVLKVEIAGRRVVAETHAHWVVEAGAGENWHAFVEWTLQQNMPGLENLALIPGTVGAAPVQNIGAYGLELQDRFHELDAVDLITGQCFTLNAAQCGFGYRDSVFKHAAEEGRGLGLAHRALITHVRFALPKKWQPDLNYADLTRQAEAHGTDSPSARQVFDWVCAVRRSKLPDPAQIGNAGSFFKNPVVSADQCADIIAREPSLVHYPLADGRFKLAAGWLIDACGWKGKSMGNAAVYEHQALVLVNRGGAARPVTGGEVMTLAHAIQTSVYERYGLRLEIEPVVV
jgi:UDP-N-acetylmuramate dehydrogenase